MSFKIGFTAEKENVNTNQNTELQQVLKKAREIKKSLVRVHFPDRNLTCTYYNDMFNLKRGDIVYVDGKLEGLRGRVVDVSYSFKIKVSDYKKVIGLAETDVMGKFHFAGSHFITLDRIALPYAQAITWFKAPTTEEEEYEYSNDGEEVIHLDELGKLKTSPETAERGHEYYMQNRVVYIEIDHTYGRAIVEGGKPYEVEFRYKNGEISNLICNCYCTGHCKHEFATLLQLRETLKTIDENYGDAYTEDLDYIAIVSKPIFFDFAFGNKQFGTFTMD